MSIKLLADFDRFLVILMMKNLGFKWEYGIFLRLTCKAAVAKKRRLVVLPISLVGNNASVQTHEASG